MPVFRLQEVHYQTVGSQTLHKLILCRRQMIPEVYLKELFQRVWLRKIRFQELF